MVAHRRLLDRQEALALRADRHLKLVDRAIRQGHGDDVRLGGLQTIRREGTEPGTLPVETLRAILFQSHIPQAERPTHAEVTFTLIAAVVGADYLDGQPGDRHL